MDEAKNIPQPLRLRTKGSRIMLLIPILMILGGCAAVGPNYTTPNPETGDAWNNSWTSGEKEVIQKDQAFQHDWWTLFDDPLLTHYIEDATESNLTVLTAFLRMEEVRARLGVVLGDRFPQVNADADVLRQRSSDNSIAGGYEETFYSPSLGASWEIDLFGRIRRSIEAATADYQATEEEYHDVMVSLYGEVSRTYFTIRTAQARLASAEANIGSQVELLELTRSRFTHGLATDLDVAQAERLLARAEAEVPPLKVTLAEGINSLSVLLGRMPGNLHHELLAVKPIPLPPTRASVGLPADLLRRRPDIRRAERVLAAETARIGIATADLYPSFSLTGIFGFESIDAGDLFDAGSRVFSFGPSLRWQIFSGGSIRNRIKAQDAVAQQALLGYEQSVLTGVLEVENSLKAYVEDRARLKALERSVEAAKRSVRLSTKLYKEGLVDFQPVLDAQRDQFNFENQLAVARGDSSINFVRLYTALGGGWQTAQEDRSESINQHSVTQYAIKE